MNVVYSSSDSYAPVAGVSMYSLLCNNRDAEELNIFLIDNCISDENKRKFTDMCEQFGRNISFVPIADIEKLAGASIDSGRWNISTFARLFYASLLPQSVKKVIHIDCDTIVPRSLKSLWETDMTGKVVAGALECIADSYKREVGMKNDDIYLQAGNIMLNLEKIREDGLEEKFKQFIREHPVLSFVDQPVLNACTTNDEKLIIPLNYNAYSIVYYLKYKNLKRAKRVSQFYSEQEVIKAKENPYIIHYTTCFTDNSRPWTENNAHPTIEFYLKYKSLSPWADVPLLKNDSKGIKKAAHNALAALPQGLSSWCVGTVHTLIPLTHKIKQRFMK